MTAEHHTLRVLGEVTLRITLGITLDITLLLRSCCALLLGLAAGAPALAAGSVAHWTPVFTAPLMAPSSFDPAAGDVALRLNHLSLRQFVPVQLPKQAGRPVPRMRIKFSNEFGDAPLVLDDLQVAWRAAQGGAQIQLHSGQALRFAGHPGVHIAPGQTVLSDPFTLERPRHSGPKAPDLAISFYLAERSPRVSWHPVASRSSYRSTPGPHLADPRFPVARVERSIYFIAAVEADFGSPPPSVWVAFGDSITDGAGHPVDTDTSWPLRWRQAWLARPGLNAVVLNAGLSGNRLLTAMDGPSGRTRFERDVLALPGVRGVVLQIGINDLGSAAPGADLGALAAAVMAAQAELLQRARALGIKVVGATLTPIRRSMHDRPGVEAARQAVNHWIRQDAGFDAVVDFDAVVRDPAHPGQFRPGWSSDALHPSQEAYRAMAEALVRVLHRAGLDLACAHRPPHQPGLPC